MASEQGFNSEIPSLCANGCGFFGRAETRNLCSKCYRDVCREEQSHLALSAPAVAAVVVADEQAVDLVDANGDGISKSEEKAKNRCGCCNKRVGLAKGFKCRCGNVYCSTHRYPEEHACSFDFKASGRDLLAKANPVVQADKLQRI